MHDVYFIYFIPFSVCAWGHVPVLLSTIALCSVGSIFILSIEVGFVSLRVGRTWVLSASLHNGSGSRPRHLLPWATSSPLALTFSQLCLCIFYLKHPGCCLHGDSLTAVSQKCSGDKRVESIWWGGTGRTATKFDSSSVEIVSCCCPAQS